MKSLFELLGIEANSSMVYHPQTDGQTEQSNATVEHFLQLYINKWQTDWVYYLPLAAMAYNNTPHSSIKCSLNEYNYRCNLYLGTQLQCQPHLENTSEFVHKLAIIHKNAHTALHAVQEAQK